MNTERNPSGSLLVQLSDQEHTQLREILDRPDAEFTSAERGHAYEGAIVGFALDRRYLIQENDAAGDGHFVLHPGSAFLEQESRRWSSHEPGEQWLGRASDHRAVVYDGDRARIHLERPAGEQNSAEQDGLTAESRFFTAMLGFWPGLRSLPGENGYKAFWDCLGGITPNAFDALMVTQLADLSGVGGFTYAEAHEFMQNVTPNEFNAALATQQTQCESHVLYEKGDAGVPAGPDGEVDFVCPGFLAALSDAYHTLKGGDHAFAADKLNELHMLLASNPLFTKPATYTSEMGAAANLYHSTFTGAHPLPAQWRWSEVWEVMKAAECIVRVTQTHVLYEKHDVDAPDVIKDRNGDIVLGLCKVCGKGEAQLSEPCEPRG